VQDAHDGVFFKFGNEAEGDQAEQCADRET
jgi:hypothetical protein